MAMEASNSKQELSKKDLALIRKLEICVNILCHETPVYEPDTLKLAVDIFKQEFLVSTIYWSNSLTDILNLLRPHYETLKDCYNNQKQDSDRKKLSADVLSVLAMINSLSKEKGTDNREALKYRLLGSENDFTTWGVKYLEKLVAQIINEYKDSFRKDNEVRLLNLVEDIVVYYMSSDLVVKAVELAIKFKELKYRPLFYCANMSNYRNTCAYILSLTRGIRGEMDYSILYEVYTLYCLFGDYPSALRVAFFMRKHEYVEEIFEVCNDLVQKKQLCDMVARNGMHFDLGYYMVKDDEERKELQGLINRKKWGQGYLAVAGYLDVIEPMSPEDVYKGVVSSGGIRNLADVFVNAFLNAGFGKDKLILGQENRVFKNEENGKVSEVASLGLIMLWDVDAGLEELLRYLQYDDSFVKAGALLGLGILNSSVRPDNDNVAVELLLDYADNEDQSIRIAAVMGLLFLGQKRVTDVPEMLNEKMRKYVEFSQLSCAYVGSGDIHEVQSLFDNCDEEAAVLGIAMVAIPEEGAIQKAIQTLKDLLLSAKQNIRKTVPLALALLSISDPNRDRPYSVVDKLHALTDDSDLEVAISAIISLGLVGSGTNNDRITAMLQTLSKSYSNNTDALFCIQISLGLLHLGKGLLTLKPSYSDEFLLSPVAIGGLVTFLHCCLDMRSLMLGNCHFVLYFLVLAMQPSMLLTVDENLEVIHVPVDVGEAVNVTGQTGQSRDITDFQTFETPVLLGSGQKAELCTDRYVPMSPILEGFIILKQNPDYEADLEE
ncbi:26S proteasome non-ATPase regulatory subunit 2-like protein B [Bienertia sinuspersici]